MNSLTTFLPLNTKIGGPARCIKDKDALCLMNDQARHIYKKVESDSRVNVDTIKWEIETDMLGNNYNLEEEGKINPYHEIITNKVKKDNTMTLQMEQWSILSNIVNYVQYNRNFYDLDIKTVDQKTHKTIYGKEEERQILELDLD